MYSGVQEEEDHDVALHDHRGQSRHLHRAQVPRIRLGRRKGSLQGQVQRQSNSSRIV